MNIFYVKRTSWITNESHRHAKIPRDADSSREHGHNKHDVNNNKRRRLKSPNSSGIFRMFGGYTDILQYNYGSEATNGQIDGDGNGYGPLPTEYLPKYNPPDPWHKPASCQQDFILIAEFSEQEGPKPLITIPKDAGGNFDLNNFSVRIMSVDYQTMASEGFCVQEDTQLVLSESTDGMFAYVHHFTLNDSQARGFVRPFCMAYVTPDHTKLMSFYEDISGEFQKVSQFFKYGNLRLFQKDMAHYLTDLQFTKARYIERQEELIDSEPVVEIPGSPEKSNLTHEDKIFRSMNLKTLASCLTEVRDILDRASDLMSKTDQNFEEHFLNLEGKSCPTSRSRSRTDSVSKQEVLLSSSFHADMPDNMIITMRQRSSSLSEIEAASSSVSDIDEYRPKLVRTINRRRFDRALRTIHELCQCGAKEGIKMLTNIHKYFSRDLVCLEIERNDRDLIEPTVGLFTVGRNVTTNFLSHMNIPQTMISPVTGLYRGDAWLSTDTIGSYKSAESFLSAKEEIDEPVIMLRSSVLDDCNSYGSYDLISSTSSIEEPDVCNSTSSSSKQINKTQKPEKNAASITNSKQCSPSTSDNSQGDIVIGSDGASSASTSISTRASSIESSLKHSTVTVISTADHISTLSPNSPGHGILQLMQQYPFTIHLLYPLLTGRLLIVTGSTKLEKEIHSTINTLRLFIPGHSLVRHNVVTTAMKPLRITDLAQLKLLGYSKPNKRSYKDQFLPACVKRYVSILDIDKKILSSPPYKGSFLRDIYDKRKHFKCEKAFVAYIHSAISDLAAKAQLYFHLTCLKSSTPTFLTEDEIFTKLKLASSDVEIVKYFVRVIEQQQFEEQQNINTDISGFGVKLDYTRCSLFKA